MTKIIWKCKDCGNTKMTGMIYGRCVKCACKSGNVPKDWKKKR